MRTFQATSPRERTLLRQAKRVTDDGKLSAAISLYKDLLTEFPESVDGLLGYARVMRDETQRVELLNQALALDPENEIAKAALRGESLDDLLNPPEPEVEVVEFVAAEPKSAETPAETHAFEADTTADEEVVGLRCNRCGKPIEAHDSILTSVGYRCKECVREIESSYFTASTTNQLMGFAVALPLATMAALLIGYLLGGGFFSWMIAFFISPAIGSAIGSAAFRAAGRNRGRYLPSLMSAAMWLGSAIALGLLFIFTLGPPLIVLGIFAFTASGAAYFRVR